MRHPEPLDPFAGDPDDPAHELAALDDPDEEELEPTSISTEELIEELEEIELMQAALSPKGIRGLSVHCADCDLPHYFDWDLMRASARHIAEFGQPRVHEPAVAPDEAAYVPYAYARGYIDAILDGDDDESADEPTGLRDRRSDSRSDERY